MSLINSDMHRGLGIGLPTRPPGPRRQFQCLRLPASLANWKIHVRHISDIYTTYVHVQHMYMLNMYTCSAYIHVQDIYISNIYTYPTFIQSIYSTHISKNSVFFIAWTYIYGLFNSFWPKKILIFKIFQ